MNIKEFSEKVRDRLEERTGLEVRTVEVIKNNSITLHGINIMVPESNMIPTIYLEQYLQSYEDGITLEEITDGIINIWENGKKINHIDMEWFRNFDKVKDKLAYKLIGFASNRELLKNIPHQKVLDLAKVYYVSVEIEKFGGGTILITNNHLDEWGITVERLDMIAQKNTPRLFPVEINHMVDIVEELYMEKVMGGEITEDALSYIELKDALMKEFPMYVMTNTKRMYGAATMCYEDALKELAEKVQSDLIILPSSIQEIIIVPTNEESDLASFKAMVYEVNRTVVEEEDILSDSVYLYSRKTDSISIV